MIFAGLVVAALYLQPAAALAQFPFDDAAPVVPAIAHPQWATLVREQERDQITIDACLQHALQCPAHLRAYRAMVIAAAALTPVEQVQAVQQFVDKHWQAAVAKGTATDQSLWRTLNNFLHAGGGRDDAAIAKYFALRQLGFDAGTLRIVIPYAAASASPRAAKLAVAVDGQTRLLVVGDIQTTDHVAPDTYAINENFWWHRALFGSGGRRSISL